MNETVVLNNLHIKAGSNTLVKNTSLIINEGEIFGLVGESGSGKTITAKAIINLLPKGLSYSADEIITAGKNMLTASAKEKKEHIGKNIGYIPQNTVFYLHPMIKIKNQIGDGYIHHMNKTKKEALEKAEALLYKVGFKYPKIVLNYYPWQLSGGMRQRCNIAMALMNDPKLIIADEPTTALDSTVQRQVMELFRKINEEMKLSILLISHDLGLVKHYSHSLAVMYAGQIVESGYTNAVFSNPKHPYTQLLIKIIPSLKIKKNEPLTEIPGLISENGRDIEGCLFFNRCPKAMDICKEMVAEHVDDKHEHYYRCNLE
ncbi:MAG TPA: ABC transporter ATP-binding protein [Sedimentibacter sp.]|jgi:oligopeptide/dipeptide ABC transporter ATP-binding protein|nr:ABC transporter ATP-binding protein [Tissierellia bacterium]HOA20026.1 ABC transporter ATP-binding protein [Sedimentibacter sp.]HOG63163.1 ABC transporter ATP-binding protein [Sedimentibacter sp.]HOT22242.1 ABC transporter ATP-binding protein [Sedimentibacter sp.]HPB79682.1 ABC transporter ATP-binding protein [Sedimentibacter sp.]